MPCKQPLVAAVACFGVLIESLGCNGTQHTAPLNVALDTEKNDAEIYRTVLEGQISDANAPIVIQDSTWPPNLTRDQFAEGFGNAAIDIRVHGRTSPDVPFGLSEPLTTWDALTTSFNSRNHEPTPLVHFGTNRKLIWASKELLDQVFEHGAWEGFYKHFPGAHIRVAFSTPGYTSDGRLAVVYFSIGNGPKGGGGNFLLLQRGAGGWKIVQKLEEWIA